VDGAALETLTGAAAAGAARRRTGVVAGLLGPGGTTVRGSGATGRGAVPHGRTLFEIGSITKVFTATLLADGVVRGHWELSTPVADLLPEGSRVPERGGVPITLEHLATHASGLPGAAIPVFRGSLELVRGRDPYADLDADGLLARLACARLRRTPGTGRLAYSNLAFGVLGLALGHATGTSYDDLVTERICRPLGLVDTLTHRQLDADRRARSALGHRGRGRRVDPWPLGGIPGAGALRSTAEDLLRFLAVQADPTGSPLEEAIRMTQEPRRTGRRGMGLGWMRTPDPDLLLWHNGGTGGFRSFAGVLREQGRGVVVLANHARSVDLTALRLLRAMDGR
jgi:CubicO group peptidase (beta-lactamase class C family)